MEGSSTRGRWVEGFLELEDFEDFELPSLWYEAVVEACSVPGCFSGAAEPKGASEASLCVCVKR